MINSFKWMFYKNNPEKLLTLYEKNQSLRSQIIKQLFSFNENEKLLDIAQKDPINRSIIIQEFISKENLSLETCVSILNWLNLSKTHKLLISYIIDRFSENSITSVLNSDKLDRVAKNIIIKKMQKMKKKDEHYHGLNEDYLKLRMLIEDETIEDTSIKKTSLFSGIRNDDRERIKRFLEVRQNIDVDREREIIKEEIQYWLESQEKDIKFILSLIQLSRLETHHLTEIIKEIDHNELYFPEKFQLITDMAKLPIESFYDFFSLTTIKSWIETYLITNYNVDLYYLYKHYSQFKWIFKDININSVSLDYIDKFSGKYYLTANYGYRLDDIIYDKEILGKLKQSCLEIHQYILENLDTNNFPLTRFLKPLFLVGGDYNFAFISKLMNRRIVENKSATIQNIERHYLNLKQKINDQEKLQILVKNEILEKENLISKEKFDIITLMFFSSVTSANYIQPIVKKSLIENLPDLEKFSIFTNTQGKVLLCKYIGLLKLEQYQQILDDFVQSDEVHLSINAAIALWNLGNASIKDILKKFALSPNYIVRSALASALSFMTNEIDESLILMLAEDEHSEVCEAAIETISGLPIDLALDYFEKLISTSYYKNRPFIVKALGRLKTPKVLPLLVELVKEADNDVYWEITQTIVKINHKVSNEFLKALDLKKNPFLEIERAKARIFLSDFDGWKTIYAFMNFNFNHIRDIAKYSFLELSTGEKLNELKELTFESNPQIACMAAAKIIIYDKTEGWTIIHRFLKEKDPLIKYYTAHLLAHFSFKNVMRFLIELYNIGEHDTKFIIALICAENGIDKYLKMIESKVLNFTDREHILIVKAANDYPSKYSLNTLKKISLLQNPDNLDDLLAAICRIDIDYAIEVIFLLWRKADNVSKNSLARALGQFRRNSIAGFILKNIEDAAPLVKIELAYSLVCQGDEKGWELLQNFLNNSDFETKKVTIEKFAQLKSKRSLDVLSQALATPNEEMQAHIIKNIGNMHLRESLPLLKKSMSSNSNKIKISVAKALGELCYPESFDLLKILKQDKNEYVKVSVEIAERKINNYIRYSEKTVKDDFANLTKSVEWNLSDAWFNRMSQTFCDKYDIFENHPLSHFNNKMILQTYEVEKRRNRIEKELNHQLTGCTDVTKIIEEKNKAKEEMDNFITKEELIKSIIEAVDEDINDDTMDVLIQSVLSNDNDIIQALIIRSGKATSLKWIEIIDKIIDTEINPQQIDLVIYSLSKKTYGASLASLIKLAYKERARYHIMFLYNYFILHPKQVKISNIKSAKANLINVEIPTNLKEILTMQLNNLLEEKLK